MAVGRLLASLLTGGWKPKETLTEFSTNFDSDWVRPFLQRIQPLIESGFGRVQVDQVCQLVATLLHDQERALEFSIRHRGRSGRFRVQIFMDDIASPDIYFFSPPDLTAMIKAEFDQFAQEKGI